MTGRIFFTAVCSVSLQEADTVCLAKVWGTAEQVLSGLVWEGGVVIFCLSECSSASTSPHNGSYNFTLTKSGS